MKRQDLLSRCVASSTLSKLMLALMLCSTAASAQVLPGNRIDALCRKDLHKTLSRLARISYTELKVCHTRRIDGKIADGVDCNDDSNVPSPLRISREEAKIRKRAGISCAGERRPPASQPVELGYDSCPAPCDSVPIGNTYDGLADCLICLGEAHTEQLSTSLFGTPGVPQGREAERCQRRVANGARSYLTTRMKLQHQCETRRERGLISADTDCQGDDAKGRMARARARLAKLIGGCADADLAALDSCAATPGAEVTCVTSAAESTADALFDAVFRPIPDSLTPSPTPTITETPTTTSTPTMTATPTDTPEPTSTPTTTSTPLPTDTPTPVDTPTPTDTPVNTSTPTNTPVDTSTPTASPTETPTPTNTPTETPTSTNTPTETPTPTNTPTETPTSTNTPTETPTSTYTPTPTATVTPTSTPACDDGSQNGSETDVDCGGSCAACPDGGGCVDGSDCSSGVCSASVCQVPTCSDGVRNQDESDIDCGGSCAPCSAGESCGTGADCRAGSSCVAGGACCGGRALVGITSTTGGDASNQDIASWSFQPTGFAGFHFADFSSTAGLTLVGDAAVNGADLRLTTNQIDQAGAVWFTEPQEVGGGFTTSFTYRLADHNAEAADGIVLVIQNDAAGTAALTATGGELGYAGLTNSVAIELDSYSNANESGLTVPHVSVQSNGAAANSAAETSSLASAVFPSMTDGLLHSVSITYTPADPDDPNDVGAIDVFLDGSPTPSLSVPFDLAEIGLFCPCSSGPDCQSGSCDANVCQEPTCTDGVENGDETGVDCGAHCSQCVSGEGCDTDDDCRNGLCDGGTCSGCSVPAPVSAGGWLQVSSDDINATNVPDLLTLVGDDDTADVTLPFPVEVEGTSYSTATISTNGWIELGGSTADPNEPSDPSNDCLPTAAHTNPLIAAYWDDLNPIGVAVRYGTIGLAPNRVFFVDYRVDISSGENGAAPQEDDLGVQIQLREGSTLISVKYSDFGAAAAGQGATIGYQGAGGLLAGSVRPLGCNAKVMDDNVDTEGWSIDVAAGSVALAAKLAHSSDDLTIANVPNLQTLDGDDNTVDVALPFSVTIDGIDYSNLTLSTNGWIEIGGNTADASEPSDPSNDCLPTTAHSNPFLAAYWDEMSTESAVRYGVTGDSPNRVFIADYRLNVRALPANDLVEFQVEVHETSDLIHVKYRQVQVGTRGQTATIGFQTGSGIEVASYPIGCNAALLDDDHVGAAGEGQSWSVQPMASGAIVHGALWSSQNDLAGELADLGVLTGDNATADVALPFPVVVEGTSYDSLTLSTNGWLELGGNTLDANDPNNSDPTNDCLPTAAHTNPLLAAYWDDMNPIVGVSYGVLGTTPNRVFVADYQLDTVASANDGIDDVSFQVQIHERSNLINVSYRHVQPLSTGNTATLGFQGAGGSAATTVHALGCNARVLDDNRPFLDWSISPGADCGDACGPCDHGAEGCASGADCVSGVCTAGTCQAPTCSDGVTNGNEVGVDCSGDCPSLCGDGQACEVDEDCVNDFCNAGVCQTPTCSDGVRNQDETDVDCGGAVCAPCADGDSCIENSDCGDGSCNSGTCCLGGAAFVGFTAATGDNDSNHNLDNWLFTPGGINLDFAGSVAPAGLNLLGSTSHSGPAEFMVLTPTGTNQVGGMWWTTRVPVQGAFATEFDFQVSLGSPPGDGIAFVIQNDAAGVSALAGSGGDLAYAGLTNSIVIEIDTVVNVDETGTAPHVSIQSKGEAANDAGDTARLGAVAFPAAADASWHTLSVTYTPDPNDPVAPGVIDVFIDGSVTPDLSVPFAMQSIGLVCPE